MSTTGVALSRRRGDKRTFSSRYGVGDEGRHWDGFTKGPSRNYLGRHREPLPGHLFVPHLRMVSSGPGWILLGVGTDR